MTHINYFLLVLFAIGPAVSTTADEIPKPAEAAKPFVHPGLLHSRAELNFIQQKISTDQQPWKSAWEQLQSDEGASLNYTPKPFAEVVRGVRNNPNIGSSDMSSDAAAAYAHALQWSLTQKKTHATKTIEILNAWSTTLASVSGHDAKLLIGMDGVAFCNAAELIRHTSTQWLEADQKQFERMLRQVFYPVIEDFHPTANGNWDASMIQTMIAMGVFLDDRAMFDRAVDYYLNGKGNGAIENYFNEFGECQESGRDQSHVQMGIGFLACACEMAWKQGVDLYGAADNRLALGFEYTAKYNLGEDVPYGRYRSVGDRYDYRSISPKGRGRFRPIYERIVHHYHDQMGIDMPYSRRAADKERPEGSHRQHMSWGTLTSYGLPVPETAETGDSVVNAEKPVVIGHGVGTANAESERPNIVVVLADDMGWGDSATYGHKIIQSPYLDKLASQGAKFTQGYSACGVCSPSRSAILTGRTPYRNGVWRHLSGVHEAHLRASEITYPELLKEAGYQTCHVGKWHLLSRQQFDNPKFPQPGVQGGFDYWMATQNNADPSHKNPKNFIRNGKAMGEMQGYSAPLVADEAIAWLKNVRDPVKPFALSVWFHEPHKPIATDIKFSSLYPNETTANATYFGNITQLDFALGKIMDTLEAEGLADNTLLIFSSDNGPVPPLGDSGGLRGHKRSDFDGGIRVPFVVRWPGHVAPGIVIDTPVIGTDIFSTVLDILDIPEPQDRTIDGVSMLPVFAGATVTRKTPMFWRTHVSSPQDRVALRLGDWKIVANDTMTEFLLFDVQEDWQEKNDLATRMPAKLEEMKQLLFKTWEDIKTEGPSEWWEAERNKPTKGGTLNY